ncbi:TetR/AcrR family transcriptional regulator [Leptothoe sp. ISB3NOV94-8A]|uniref:TetR/AcrR family transcriptional regulator n=1 Tax=Adonisia turfae CCMR0081 TaxID=2292702 RepID=A0A6M0RQI8_9CYAN|nr:TetR/AcrR family transcriptional regulator [Adonisia turfae]NEZ57961.1 TetR/AcrR family transcriptional regulator [Adonisia turfae CCMR0081]
MGKGEQTRQAILETVAILFNEKGYAATSMQDITRATGIQRGGIYNHFSSKDELALETFEYALSVLKKQLIRGIAPQKTAVGRLKAIATTFAELYSQNPRFPCGCQVLNTAVEAKRHMLPLRQKAQEAMNQLKALIVETVVNCVEQDELPNAVDGDEIATIFIATLEGAMLLSVLYDDSVHLHRAVNHLHGYINSLATGSKA